MKKIMFNDKHGLTRAVLEGSKTMTRRIISPKTWKQYCEYERGYNDAQQYLLGGLKDSREYLLDLSPYKVGEVVAIAQSYHTINKSGFVATEWYEHLEDSAGYDNKMFVRADLMPHHIKITEVKVERLQDISNEDCLKEGIEITAVNIGFGVMCGYEVPFTDCGTYFDPRSTFAALIDKVSGKETWECNPWVFVYEFELID